MQEDKLDAGRRIFAEAIQELNKQITVHMNEKIQAAIAPLAERIAALEDEIKMLKGHQDSGSSDENLEQ